MQRISPNLFCLQIPGARIPCAACHTVDQSSPAGTVHTSRSRSQLVLNVALNPFLMNHQLHLRQVRGARLAVACRGYLLDLSHLNKHSKAGAHGSSHTHAHSRITGSSRKQPARTSRESTVQAAACKYGAKIMISWRWRDWP